MSQRGDGAATHGVDVAQGVGGGDLAECVGIVHDGGEEVDGLHQREVGSDFVNAGVIGVIKTHQNIGIVLVGQLPQNFVEDGGAQFGGTATGFDCLGEADAFDVRHGNILKEIVESKLEAGRPRAIWTDGERLRPPFLAFRFTQLLYCHICHAHLRILMVPVGGDVLESQAERFALGWGQCATLRSTASGYGPLVWRMRSGTSSAWTIWPSESLKLTCTMACADGLVPGVGDRAVEIGHS